jgi:hypothetical protein
LLLSMLISQPRRLALAFFFFFLRVYFFDCSFGCRESGGKENRLNLLSIMIIIILFSFCGDRPKFKRWVRQCGFLCDLRFKIPSFFFSHTFSVIKMESVCTFLFVVF